MHHHAQLSSVYTVLMQSLTNTVFRKRGTHLKICFGEWSPRSRNNCVPICHAHGSTQIPLWVCVLSYSHIWPTVNCIPFWVPQWNFYHLSTHVDYLCLLCPCCTHYPWPLRAVPVIRSVQEISQSTSWLKQPGSSLMWCRLIWSHIITSRRYITVW